MFVQHLHVICTRTLPYMAATNDLFYMQTLKACCSGRSCMLPGGTEQPLNSEISLWNTGVGTVTSAFVELFHIALNSHPEQNVQFSSSSLWFSSAPMGKCKNGASH